MLVGVSQRKSKSSSSGKAGQEYKSGWGLAGGVTPALSTATAFMAAILTQS